MRADEPLLADLADFTVRLGQRLDRMERETAEARRLALDALDLLAELTGDRSPQPDEARW